MCQRMCTSDHTSLLHNGDMYVEILKDGSSQNGSYGTKESGGIYMQGRNRSRDLQPVVWPISLRHIQIRGSAFTDCIPLPPFPGDGTVINNYRTHLIAFQSDATRFLPGPFDELVHDEESKEHHDSESGGEGIWCLCIICGVAQEIGRTRLGVANLCPLLVARDCRPLSGNINTSSLSKAWAVPQLCR